MSFHLLGVTLEELKRKFPQHEFELFEDCLWIDNRRLPVEFPSGQQLMVFTSIMDHRDRIKNAFFAEVQYELDIRAFGYKVARKIRILNTKK